MHDNAALQNTYITLPKSKMEDKINTGSQSAEGWSNNQRKKTKGGIYDVV